MELEPSGTAVKLSITHTIEREASKFIAAVSGGWPKIISNLKSLLETGSIVLQDRYPVQSAEPGIAMIPAFRSNVLATRVPARLRARGEHRGSADCNDLWTR